MADIVDKQTRSRMMSGVRGKDTKPEIVVRKLLHSHGYRFRLHRKDLPGRPDIVLPKYRTAVLVHGCFWHGNDDCHLFRLPRSRTGFWKEKIEGNRARDRKNILLLHEASWRTLEIWECALKGKFRLESNSISVLVSDFLEGRQTASEIRSSKKIGMQPPPTRLQVAN